MGRLGRTMRIERLESRSLLAAVLGIADVVVDQAAGDPQVATSIEIDNAAGIRAATVEILYDQNLLQADLASVRAGSIWEGKGVAIANLNDQDGKITAFIFATEDRSLSSGTLLDIDFMFNDGSPENARAHVGLGSVRLNEGDIPISPVPIQGQRTIDGSITRQAGPASPAISAASGSPLRLDSPAQPAAVARGTIPRAGGPQRLPQPPQVAALSSPQQTRLHQELPMHHGPLAGDEQHPSPEPQMRFLCAPWPDTAAEKYPLAAAALSSEPSLPPLIERAAGVSSAQAADREPAAEPTALPSAVTEKSAAVSDRPAPDSPDALLANRAKQTLEAADLAKRQPFVLKTFPLFVGTPGSGKAGGLGAPLLWLLSRRTVSEPESDDDGDDR